MPLAEQPVLHVLHDRWWIAIVAFAVSLAATPLVRWLAYRYRIVDKPDDLLKPHGRPIAYLGGVAICLGLLAGLFCHMLGLPLYEAGSGVEAQAHSLAYWWHDLANDLSAGHFAFGDVRDYSGLTTNPLWKMPLLIAAFLVITIVGLVDDIMVMRPRQKILGQLLAAGLLLISGLGDKIAYLFVAPLTSFQQPWLIFSLSVPMCMILVVGACNATNLLDGMDGLCGGVTGIISLGFLALAVFLAVANEHPQTDGIRLALCLAMFGAVMGFLPYNLPPASIFMGDAGSMLLGFFVAAMMMAFTREYTGKWFLASAVVFALPILDTGMAVVRRLLAGKSIFAGDRSHLYDQLVDRGLSVKQVVGLFYLLSAAAAAIGVFFAIVLRFREALPVYLILLVVVVWIFYMLNMLTPPPEKHDKSQAGDTALRPAETTDVTNKHE